MKQPTQSFLTNKRTFLIFIGLIVLAAIGLLYLLSRDNVAQVDRPQLDLYAGPDASYGQLGQLEEGQSYHPIDQKGEWMKVHLSDHRLAWIHQWEIEDQEPRPEDAEDKNEDENKAEDFTPTQQIADHEQLAVVVGEYANVRDQADEEANLLGQVNQGQELKVIQEDEGWVQVQYDQAEGWIRGDLVQVIENNIDHDPNRPPLSHATIVIDPGHGGTDPGAVSPDYYEKQIAMETAQRLANHLQSLGTTVVLTRTADVDVSLESRAALSNQHQADAFISIHYDSSDIANEKSGTSTYYYDAADKELAEHINPYLAEYGPLNNLGIHYGDFQVLRDNNQPSVLLELGFLNNDHDRRIMNTDDYQNIMVEAITQGLTDYFNQ